MTMAEGVLRPDSLTAPDGRLSVAVHLPWYRSLPLSCLEAIHVRLDDVPVDVVSIAVPGFEGTTGDALDSDVDWDLRDALDVATDAPARSGQTARLEVALDVRIPYIQRAPGVPLVQRTVVQTEGTIL